jgi:hypothetical protein
MRCIQIFWRLIGPNGSLPFVCALYRLPDGSLELRVGHGEQDPLLCQRVQTEGAAEPYADTWRAAAEAQGFRELDQDTSSGAAQ